MDIDAELAGRIFGVSGRHARRLLARMGTPRVVGQASQHLWGLRHLLGAQTTAALLKLHVLPTDAEAVGRAIAAEPNDEQLEGALNHGRRLVMIVGANAQPCLLFVQNIERVKTERAEVLAELGLAVSALDVKPLFNDLRAAVAAATAEREGVADGR